MKSKNLKVVITFSVILILLAITIGIIYSKIKLSAKVDEIDLINGINLISINTFITQLGIIFLAFLTSFIGLGFLLYFFYIIYQSFLCGIIIYTFITLYSIKGLLISIIYIVFYKLIIFFIILILIVSSFKILYYIYLKKIKKTEINHMYYLNIIKKSLILFTIYIIYNLILILINNYIHPLLLNI